MIVYKSTQPEPFSRCARNGRHLYLLYQEKAATAIAAGLKCGCECAVEMDLVRIFRKLNRAETEKILFFQLEITKTISSLLQFVRLIQIIGKYHIYIFLKSKFLIIIWFHFIHYSK